MAIDQRVELHARPAHRAFAGGIAGVTVEIVLIVDAHDREAFTGIHTGEDRADTGRDAAVIADRLDGGLRGISGGDGGRQNQHMLAHDHRRGVVAEDQLAAGGVFRRGDIDGAMGVHVHVTGARELFGHACADDLCPVQTQDGVDDGGGVKLTAQHGSRITRLGKAVFGHRHVDVVIEVAVAGGKVSCRKAKLDVAVAVRELDQFNGHSAHSCLFVRGVFGSANAAQHSVFYM